MSYIRHESLFTLQELYRMEQKDRFREIFATVDLTPILRLVRKTSRFGAPVEVNYRAMVYSLIVRILECIPTIKDLIRRLQSVILFRMDCDFMLSESIPSASSYSRLIQKLSDSHARKRCRHSFYTKLWQKGFLQTIRLPSTRHISKRVIKPLPRKRYSSLYPKSVNVNPRLNGKLGWHKNKQKNSKSLFFRKKLLHSLVKPFLC